MSTKKKVLLVDDDADFVDMNRAVLEKNGYEVIAACDGTQCLERVQAERPDLIILDVMMATKDEGFGVSRKLRKMSETIKGTPILMVTSVNKKPLRVDPDDSWLPVQKILDKPVPPDVLLQEVRAQLGQ